MTGRVPRRIPGRARSADGTLIAFDRSGTGPAVVLVHGAFTDRTHPTMYGVASALAPWFTVFNYDRRGRGGSGDTRPYAVEREIEDLAAVIRAAVIGTAGESAGESVGESVGESAGGTADGSAGGSAMVFGGFSGAALALEAAGAPGIAAISKLAVWEPPYRVDDRPPDRPYGLPYDLGARLMTLVEQGRRAEAVELFLVEAAGSPAGTVTAMRAHPSWPTLEGIAPTLAYEAAVMGPGNVLPTGVLASISQPVLVLTGGYSPPWLAKAGKAVAGAVPRAVHRILEDQTHDVTSAALAPELLEFFITA
jgi:hypothetical protein